MTKRNTFFVLAALALLPARGVAQAAPGCGDGGEWTLRRCIDSMVELTDIAEREAAAEILLEAKGFEDVVVSITGEQADVVVNMAEVDEAGRAQIEDIVKRKTGISGENIIITPVAAQE